MTIQALLKTGMAGLALAITIAASPALAQDGGTPIPQPKVENLPVAGASKRVDLTLPKFSNQPL